MPGSDATRTRGIRYNFASAALGAGWIRLHVPVDIYSNLFCSKPACGAVRWTATHLWHDDLRRIVRGSLGADSESITWRLFREISDRKKTMTQSKIEDLSTKVLIA